MTQTRETTPHIVAIDFETTGTDCAVHEIAEVGLIRLTSDLKTEICRFGSKVRLEHLERAHPKALAIWQYNPEEWADAPTLDFVMRIVADMASDAVLLAYNAPFDEKFANAAFAQCKISRPWAGNWHIDAMRWGTRLKAAGVLESKGLAAVAQYALGKVQPEPHRALDDIELTVEVERWGRAGMPLRAAEYPPPVLVPSPQLQGS